MEIGDAVFEDQLTGSQVHGSPLKMPADKSQLYQDLHPKTPGSIVKLLKLNFLEFYDYLKIDQSKSSYLAKAMRKK